MEVGADCPRARDGDARGPLAGLLLRALLRVPDRARQRLLEHLADRRPRRRGAPGAAPRPGRPGLSGRGPGSGARGADRARLDRDARGRPRTRRRGRARRRARRRPDRAGARARRDRPRRIGAARRHRREPPGARGGDGRRRAPGLAGGRASSPRRASGPGRTGRRSCSRRPAFPRWCRPRSSWSRRRAAWSSSASRASRRRSGSATCRSRRSTCSARAAAARASSPQAVELVGRRREAAAALVTHEFTLEQAPEAIAYAMANPAEVMKAVVRVRRAVTDRAAETLGRLFDVRGTRVVVTGAASGLGFAMAEVLADCGAHVTLADIDEGAARGVHAEARPARRARPRVRRRRQGRGTGAGAVRRRRRRAKGAWTSRSPTRAWPRCPASASRAARRSTPSAREDWDTVLDVNLNGVMHTMRAAAAVMKRQGAGRIVVTASNAGPAPRADGLLRVRRQQGGGDPHGAPRGARARAGRHPRQRDLPRARSTAR